MPRRRRLHVASPQPAARHGEPTKYSPPMPRPPGGDRGWMGVICWSRNRAVPSGAADGRPSLSRCPPLEPGSDPRLTLTGADMADFARRRQRVAGARPQRQGSDRLVTRIAPRAVSLVAELRGHERWAAEELVQWKRRGGAEA